MTEQSAVLPTDINVSASAPPQSATVLTDYTAAVSGNVTDCSVAQVGGKTSVTIKTDNTGLKVIQVLEVNAGQTHYGCYYSAGTATIRLTKSEICDQLVPVLKKDVTAEVVYKTNITPPAHNVTRFRFDTLVFELPV